MPKKRHPCEKCGNPTNGKLCKPCDIVRRNTLANEYAPGMRKIEWRRKQRYGLEEGEFDAFWIVFKGRCGICNTELKMPSPGKGQKNDVVAIDHDHATGQVRGLLCGACNKGLGAFKDNPEILMNAVKWVTK